MSLTEVITKITILPATILGINSGHLSLGANADVTIFDPEAAWIVTANSLKSQGKNTPFLNLEVTGKVIHTLLNGQFTYQSVKH